MTHRERALMIGVALGATLVMIVLLGGRVSAAAPPDGSGTHKIVLRLQNGRTQGTELISARLTNGEQLLGNQPVDFYVSAEFFGKQQIKLGTVTTDATGTATITYQPRWQGSHLITARCRGDGEHPPVEASQTLQYSGPVVAYASRPVGLEPVRHWAPVVVVLAVAAVWALLLFVAFRTVRGIARSSVRSDERRVRYNLRQTIHQD